MAEDFKKHPVRCIIVRVMPGIRDRHEVTTGHALVSFAAMVDRNHRIGIAPDDEQVLRTEPTKSVDGLDALALRTNHPAHRG